MRVAVNRSSKRQRTTIQGHDARQQDRVGAEWNDDMSHSLRPRNLI